MKTTKLQKKIMRHKRIRMQISGTADRPRVAMFRSNRFIYAQVIDDIAGKTILSTSDIQPKKSKAKTKVKKSESASATAKKMAEAMKAKGISQAILDRGGFKYHGRIKAFADGLREGGIKI